MGERYWYFENYPEQQFDFQEPLPVDLNLFEPEVVTKRVADDILDESLQTTRLLSTFGTGNF